MMARFGAVYPKIAETCRRLSRFARAITRTHSVPRSNEWALRRLLGRKRCKDLVAESPDWRILPERAAAALHTSMDDLLPRLARLHGIRFALRLKPASVPQGFNLSIAQLREAGALPVFSERGLTALIVVDPSQATALASSYPSAEVCLGSWREILLALEQSEFAMRVSERDAEIQATARTRDMAQRVLAFILQESANLKAASLWIGRLSVGCGYRLSLANGGIATGSIDERVWPELSLLLSARSDRGLTEVTGNPAEGFTLNQFAPRQDRPDALTERETLAMKPEVRSQALMQLNACPETLSSKGWTVLLIEDNATFASVISRFLSRSGMHTIHCASGADAQQIMQSNAMVPRLIICDVHMPGMSGIEFLSQLGVAGPWSAVPALMLTSDTSVETEIAALQAGARVLLPKSVDPRLLCAYAHRLVQDAAAGSMGSIA